MIADGNSVGGKSEDCGTKGAEKLASSVDVNASGGSYSVGGSASSSTSIVPQTLILIQAILVYGKSSVQVQREKKEPLKVDIIKFFAGKVK